jgi:hypothetical protein
LALSSLPASLSSSNNFEIGSSHCTRKDLITAAKASAMGRCWADLIFDEHRPRDP